MFLRDLISVVSVHTIIVTTVSSIVRIFPMVAVTSLRFFEGITIISSIVVIMISIVAVTILPYVIIVLTPDRVSTVVDTDPESRGIEPEIVRKI